MSPHSLTMLSTLTRTFLVVIVIMCIRCKNSCIDYTGKVLENSYIEPRYTSLTFQPHGMLQCAKKCILFTKCAIWDYNRETLKCTIHTTAQGLTTRKGYIAAYKGTLKQEFPGNYSKCLTSDSCLPYICKKVCLPNYHRFDSDLCIKFIGTKNLTNSKSQEACTANGGNLFTVDTATKATKLKSYIKDRIHNLHSNFPILLVWIDGYRWNNGTWTTYNGKTFTPVFDSSYSSVQPNDHCLGFLLNTNGTPSLEIMNCSYLGFYVCQYKL